MSFLIKYNLLANIKFDNVHIYKSIYKHCRPRLHLLLCVVLLDEINRNRFKKYVGLMRSHNY